MPRPRLRSRSLRRVHVKLPGGRRTVHYTRRKPKKAHCSRCHGLLAGVPRVRPAGMRKLAKTERRPERPYGGMLCSSCMRAVYQQRVREGKFNV